MHTCSEVGVVTGRPAGLVFQSQVAGERLGVVQLEEVHPTLLVEDNVLHLTLVRCQGRRLGVHLVSEGGGGGGVRRGGREGGWGHSG